MTNDELENTLSPYDYAAIYARRSSPKDSLSIDTQINLAKEMAQKKNLLIFDIYSEQSSATGNFEEKRTELKRLINDAKDNKFKTVIVFRRDRLSRNVTDSVNINNIFKEHGVKVIYTDVGEFVSDGSMISEFIESMIIGISELEAEMTRNRVEPGRENKRQRAEYASPKIPFVFKKTGIKPNKFVLKDENVSSLVSSLFEEYIKAGGINDKVNEIFKTLKSTYWNNNNKSKNDDGYNNCTLFIKLAVLAGLQTKDRKRKVVDTFILNQKTCMYEIDKSLYQKCSNVEAAISEDLWFKAMNIWRKNYKPKIKIQSTLVFKGLLFCSSCKKEVKLINNEFKCYKGCTKIGYDYLVKSLINKFIDDFISTNIITEYIQSKIKDLENKMQVINNNMAETKHQMQLEIRKNLIDFEVLKNSPKLKEEYNKLSNNEKEKQDIIASINSYNNYLSIVEKIIQNKDSAIDILINEENIKLVNKFLSNTIKKVELVGTEIKKIEQRK